MDHACPGCGRLLPLQAFRKWWGAKRALRLLCVKCEPERSLERMSPEERTRAVDQQRPYATPMRVVHMNAREADAERRRRSTAAKRRHSRERTQAWAPVMRALEDEREWCRRALLTLRGSADPPPGGPAWAAFFAAYETALTEALRLARIARNNRAQPRHDELREPIHAYLYPATCSTLRALYGNCRPIPGRRLYRDPTVIKYVDTVSTKERA